MKRHLFLWSPDENGGASPATSPQAGDGGSAPPPQAGDTTSGEPQAGEPQSPSTKSATEYEAMIRKLRDENAASRTKLKAFEDEERKRQEAQLSEQQKAEKRLADLQKQHEDYRAGVQDRLVNSELRSAAADLGFADPSDAARLLDRSELLFDDEGVPTNAKAVLDALAKAKPYLLKQQQSRQAPTSGGATNPSRGQTNRPSEVTREYVNGILAKGNAEWNALPKDEQDRISRWIQGGGLMRR